MIIIDAGFPAGMTIEEAISEALEFSERNKCMVWADINDVKVPIVSMPGVFSREDAVLYYRRIYDGFRNITTSTKPKESK